MEQTKDRNGVTEADKQEWDSRQLVALSLRLEIKERQLANAERLIDAMKVELEWLRNVGLVTPE